MKSPWQALCIVVIKRLDHHNGQRTPVQELRLLAEKNHNASH
ncbi:hypothetical protein OR573_02265 [Halomonas sp. CH40]